MAQFVAHSGGPGTAPFTYTGGSQAQEHFPGLAIPESSAYREAIDAATGIINRLRVVVNWMSDRENMDCIASFVRLIMMPSDKVPNRSVYRIVVYNAIVAVDVTPHTRGNSGTKTTKVVTSTGGMAGSSAEYSMWFSLRDPTLFNMDSQFTLLQQAESYTRRLYIESLRYLLRFPTVTEHHVLNESIRERYVDPFDSYLNHFNFIGCLEDPTLGTARILDAVRYIKDTSGTTANTLVVPNNALTHLTNNLNTNEVKRVVAGLISFEGIDIMPSSVNVQGAMIGPERSYTPTVSLTQISVGSAKLAVSVFPQDNASHRAGDPDHMIVPTRVLFFPRLISINNCVNSMITEAGAKGDPRPRSVLYPNFHSGRMERLTLTAAVRRCSAMLMDPYLQEGPNGPLFTDADFPEHDVSMGAYNRLVIQNGIQNVDPLLGYTMFMLWRMRALYRAMPRAENQINNVKSEMRSFARLLLAHLEPGEVAVGAHLNVAQPVVSTNPAFSTAPTPRNVIEHGGVHAVRTGALVAVVHDSDVTSMISARPSDAMAQKLALLNAPNICTSGQLARHIVLPLNKARFSTLYNRILPASLTAPFITGGQIVVDACSPYLGFTGAQVASFNSAGASFDAVMTATQPHGINNGDRIPADLTNASIPQHSGKYFRGALGYWLGVAAEAKLYVDANPNCALAMLQGHTSSAATIDDLQEMLIECVPSLATHGVFSKKLNAHGPVEAAIAHLYHDDMTGGNNALTFNGGVTWSALSVFAYATLLSLGRMTVGNLQQTVTAGANSKLLDRLQLAALKGGCDGLVLFNCSVPVVTTKSSLTMAGLLFEAWPELHEAVLYEIGALRAMDLQGDVNSDSFARYMISSSQNNTAFTEEPLPTRIIYDLLQMDPRHIQGTVPGRSPREVQLDLQGVLLQVAHLIRPANSLPLRMWCQDFFYIVFGIDQTVSSRSISAVANPAIQPDITGLLGPPIAAGGPTFADDMSKASVLTQLALAANMAVFPFSTQQSDGLMPARSAFQAAAMTRGGVVGTAGVKSLSTGNIETLAKQMLEVERTPLGRLDKFWDIARTVSYHFKRSSDSSVLSVDYLEAVFEQYGIQYPLQCDFTSFMAVRTESAVIGFADHLDPVIAVVHTDPYTFTIQPSQALAVNGGFIHWCPIFRRLHGVGWMHDVLISGYIDGGYINPSPPSEFLNWLGRARKSPAHAWKRETRVANTATYFRLLGEDPPHAASVRGTRDGIEAAQSEKVHEYLLGPAIRRATRGLEGATRNNWTPWTTNGVEASGDGTCVELFTENKPIFRIGGTTGSLLQVAMVAYHVQEVPRSQPNETVFYEPVPVPGLSSNAISFTSDPQACINHFGHGVQLTPGQAPRLGGNGQ